MVLLVIGLWVGIKSASHPSRSLLYRSPARPGPYGHPSRGCASSYEVARVRGHPCMERSTTATSRFQSRLLNSFIDRDLFNSQADSSSSELAFSPHGRPLPFHLVRFTDCNYSRSELYRAITLAFSQQVVPGNQLLLWPNRGYQDRRESRASPRRHAAHPECQPLVRRWHPPASFDLDALRAYRRAPPYHSGTAGS